MTTYELRISDWSSDVCSSDLRCLVRRASDRRYQLRHDCDLVAAIDQRDAGALERHQRKDRKRVGEGKSVSVRVDGGGRRIIKKKHTRESATRHKTYITIRAQITMPSELYTPTNNTNRL